MKKLTALAAFLALAAAVFACLWLWEKNDRSELETLCQTNAAIALQEFSAYRETGENGHYWDGVANFRAFLNSWLAASEETPPEYVWFNSVYGFMILAPEKVQAAMDDLVAALEIVGADYTDPNGPLRISELNNRLVHE